MVHDVLKKKLYTRRDDHGPFFLTAHRSVGLHLIRCKTVQRFEHRTIPTDLNIDILEGFVKEVPRRVK